MVISLLAFTIALAKGLTGKGYFGVLTMPVYRTLPKADVTCLDYSPDMMAQTKRRARPCAVCAGGCGNPSL